MVKSDKQTGVQRLVLALVGALGGVTAWHFGELANRMVDYPRLFLAMVSFVMGAFAVLLAVIGPLGWLRALAAAVGLSAVISALLTWCTFRFDRLEPFFDSGLPFVAMALLFLIGTPFVSAGLQHRRGIFDYPLLFDTAWAVFVRHVAAWGFAGVAWGLVFLSDALLKIVGVSVIRDILDIAPVPYAVTGLFLGLAIAIIHEQRDYISPFLVLRLFRVILPVLVPVVGVFLVALPFRGLDHLFGEWSVAATLMAVALAAITLITSALDRSPDEEARAPVMRWGARVMCLMLLPLCAAAGWAVWIRVAAYGLTPARVAAGLGASVLLGYALLYTAAALLPGWTARIRQGNLVMALVVLGLSALWLTPAINAEAFSTRSQVARFMNGDTGAAGLALWEMKADWGRAGRAGLEELRTRAGAGDERAENLVTALERLDDATSEYAFRQANEASGLTQEELSRLQAQVVVYPEGQSISAEEFATLPPFALERLQASCPRLSDESPGCVIILADLDPHRPGEEGLILQRTDSVAGLTVQELGRRDGQLSTGRDLFSDVTGARLADRRAALIEAMRTGEIIIEPSGIRMISLGGTSLIP